jgi:Ca2+-transporting ATPase
VNNYIINYNGIQYSEQLKGLTEAEVKSAQHQFGFNELATKQKPTWYSLLFSILKEPMLLLLLAVSIIYLVVGNYAEALFMLVAIVAVSAISFYQDNRSKKALEAIEKLNEPLSVVIRNSKVISIPTHELTIDDLCIVEEGKMINADGKIVHSNDFSVNEASLTGESFSVFKSIETEDRNIYSGTLVVSGLAIFKISAIGKNTRIGKLGQSIQDIKNEDSPLQIQIAKFVKAMAIIGIIIFY